MLMMGSAVFLRLPLFDIDHQGIVLLDIGDPLGFGLILIELPGAFIALLLLNAKEPRNSQTYPPHTERAPSVYKLHNLFINHVPIDTSTFSAVYSPFW